MRGVYTHHPLNYLRIETYSYTIKQYWACCGRKKRAGPGCKSGPHPNLFGLERSDDKDLCVVINSNSKNSSPDMTVVKGERGGRGEKGVRGERGLRGRSERREGSERRDSNERRERLKSRAENREGERGRERIGGRFGGREGEEDKEMDHDNGYGNFENVENEEEEENGVNDFDQSPNSNTESEDFNTEMYKSIQAYEVDTENKKYYDLKYGRFEGKEQSQDKRVHNRNFGKKTSPSNFCIPKKTAYSNHGFPTDSTITVLSEIENEFSTNTNYASNIDNIDRDVSEIRSKKKVGFDFDRERKKEYLM
jgi:hypothetical protein